MRRARVHDCIFDSCDFSKSEVNSAEFNGSYFLPCNFDENNLQFLDFSGYTFKRRIYKAGISIATTKFASYLKSVYNPDILNWLVIHGCT